MDATEKIIRQELRLTTSSFERFSSLLQAGIHFTNIRNGETIGAFLNKLPGFNMNYIRDRVQTIFLNGTAIDDLETPLAGAQPVLAISSAMPGLAGSIFRKNSLHATLRSSAKKNALKTDMPGTTTVTLKLFNVIARERGAELLHGGCTIKVKDLVKFLQARPPLLSSMTEVFLNGEMLRPGDIITRLAGTEEIKLTIREAA